MNDPAAIIAALELAPSIIIPLVRAVPEENLKRRPQPDKWAAHEHACHLAVVHPLFFSRLDLMLTAPHAKIIPYQPDQDDEAGALLRMNLDEALEKFSSDRMLLVERLRGLSMADWGRTAEHEEYNHYSVFIMFRHLALHDMLHEYRIEELLLQKEWAF